MIRWIANWLDGEVPSTCSAGQKMFICHTARYYLRTRSIDLS